MRFDTVYKRLSETKYPIFSYEDLRTFFPKEKKSTVAQCLSRWKKSGLVVWLKKGLYELSYPARQVLSDMLVANRMVTPSYVSLETALSHYSLIPEVSAAVLSISSKPTRRFKNIHGLFIYRSVQPRAFRGYTLENDHGFEVLIAEPEKALVDTLYLKTRRASTFELDSLRLDRKRVKRLDDKKLWDYGRLYGMNTRELLHAYL